jgi:hypothetical protein
VFCRSSNTTAGIGFDGDRLSYHWNDAGWWWNSGLSVPQNEWTHVALVVEPTRVTMYLNGRPAVDNAARGAEEFDGPLTIGEDPNGGGRFFNGLVDEVRVYRRALESGGNPRANAFGSTRCRRRREPAGVLPVQRTRRPSRCSTVAAPATSV